MQVFSCKQCRLIAKILLHFSILIIGSQHSGATAEDEREGDDDQEDDQSQQEILEARCLVCDKQFQDIEM